MSDAGPVEVRILAHWIDDPTESPVTLDARIDARSRRLLGRWTIFGAVCIDAENCRPFALDAHGVMDFGAARADERYWRTDIRGKEIAVGATFAIIWPGGDSGVYKIEKVARLGAKSGAQAE